MLSVFPSAHNFLLRQVSLNPLFGTGRWQPVSRGVETATAASPCRPDRHAGDQLAAPARLPHALKDIRRGS